MSGVSIDEGGLAGADMNTADTGTDGAGDSIQNETFTTDSGNLNDKNDTKSPKLDESSGRKLEGESFLRLNGDNENVGHKVIPSNPQDISVAENDLAYKNTGSQLPLEECNGNGYVNSDEKEISKSTNTSNVSGSEKTEPFPTETRMDTENEETEKYRRLDGSSIEDEKSVSSPEKETKPEMETVITPNEEAKLETKTVITPIEKVKLGSASKGTEAAQSLTTEKSDLGLNVITKEEGVSSDSPAETTNSTLVDRLKSAETERDQIQASYNALLNKLLSMKAFFGKMKETEHELEQVRAALETANDEKQAVVDVAASMKRELLAAEKAAEKAAQEAKKDREAATDTTNQLRSQVSDLNAECDRLSQSLTSTRRELVAQAEQLQDEKYTLEHKCNALEKKGASDRKAAQAFEVSREEYKAETTQLRLAVEELKTLNETLGAQNLESREKVKLLSQTLMAQHDSIAKQQADHAEELERLNAQVDLARAGEALLQQALAVKQAELDAATEQIASERAAGASSKAELSAKAATIGQLRHELVTVNEHLTKALTMLKKQGTSNQVVDRQLISNVFISFLQLARGDAKKFQALELIAALLEWDSLQKIAAGLSHGQGNATTDSHRRQSFISLWTEYLEKELSA